MYVMWESVCMVINLVMVLSVLHDVWLGIKLSHDYSSLKTSIESIVPNACLWWVYWVFIILS